MAFEGDEPKQYYSPEASRKECRNTTIYCVLSLALFILAGAINSPIVRDSVPGGAATLALLSIGIVVSVLILCLWQAPRPRRS